MDRGGGGLRASFGRGGAVRGSAGWMGVFVIGWGGFFVVFVLSGGYVKVYVLFFFLGWDSLKELLSRLVSLVVTFFSGVFVCVCLPPSFTQLSNLITVIFFDFQVLKWI